MNRTNPSAQEAYAKFCKLRKKLQEVKKNTDASTGKQQAIIYTRFMQSIHLRWHKQEK